MSARPLARSFIQTGLWIVLLVSAMLLPFLPGRHDPFAVTFSVAATGVAFGGLLLVPIGAVCLSSARGYAPARVAMVVATLVAAGTTVMTAAVGSLAAAAILLAACGAWLMRRALAPESSPCRTGSMS